MAKKIAPKPEHSSKHLYDTVNVRRDAGTLAVIDQIEKAYIEMYGFGPRRHEVIHRALTEMLERVKIELRRVKKTP